MIFFENLLNLRLLYVKTIDDLCQEINVNMVKHGFKNPKLNSAKFLYHSRSNSENMPSDAVYRAAIEAFELDPKDKRFEVLKTNFLEWKELWLLAGFSHSNDVELPEFVNDQPNVVAFGENFWNNLEYIERLLKIEGKNLDLSDIDMNIRSFRTIKCVRKMVPYDVVKQFGKKFNIYPYTKLYLTPFDREMEDQLWNQFITSEQDLLSKRVLQLEVALDIQSQRLVKKILRPVDEADSFFDKANSDKSQLIEKLSFILNEYEKIEKIIG